MGLAVLSALSRVRSSHTNLYHLNTELISKTPIERLEEYQIKIGFVRFVAKWKMRERAETRNSRVVFIFFFGKKAESTLSINIDQ